MSKVLNASDHPYRLAKTTTFMRCSGQRAQELQRTQPHPHMQRPSPLLSSSVVQNTLFCSSTQSKNFLPKETTSFSTDSSLLTLSIKVRLPS